MLSVNELVQHRMKYHLELMNWSEIDWSLWGSSQPIGISSLMGELDGS
jgi:hypothetical protein